ncbi:gene transfer agent family protein [Cereibacter azotoformans]|uniref:gene transfer agent family protein n=1 Tax=Cereibacter azotoformans TaxID=43057 RepID=UPI000E360012|nr:gene transfer agent family protein [Cereibacter azotoformans]AXQ93205.1 gene transfer agent family protein [Cereibacter sphaeroides]UIJ31517.1 gene transfer agent family protein [Cereibacter azotoformans]
MSRSAEITLDWADGTYLFALKWGQLGELQEKCDAGPYVVLGRLADGSWKVGDISDTIRLGLIGGGMAPAAALKKVRAYVEDRPPFENLQHAQAILSAALLGAPEERTGKPRAGGRRATRSRAERSASPESTAPEPPSA